mgnify:CR=1
MFGSWTQITWLTFGKRCVGFETRYAVATAGNRPERKFGLTTETSELLAKAFFGTYVVVDKGSDFPSQILDSPFDGE